MVTGAATVQVPEDSSLTASASTQSSMSPGIVSKSDAKYIFDVAGKAVDRVLGQAAPLVTSLTVRNLQGHDEENRTVEEDELLEIELKAKAKLLEVKRIRRERGLPSNASSSVPQSIASENTPNKIETDQASTAADSLPQRFEIHTA